MVELEARRVRRIVTSIERFVPAQQRRFALERSPRRQRALLITPP